MLPSMALFAKITPRHIEATVFAFLTGVFNFCNTVLGPMMGSLYNYLFVGVSNSDMS